MSGRDQQQQRSSATMTIEEELKKLPSDASRRIVARAVDETGFDASTRALSVSPSDSAGDNFFGEMYRVRVEERSTGRRAHYVLKLAPSDEQFRKSMPVDRYYEREIAAYTHVLPALDGLQRAAGLAPSARFAYAALIASSGAARDELVLLDDLCARGFRARDRLASLDAEHARRAVEQLARLHAASFALKRADPARFAELTARVCRGADYGANFGRFVAQNRDLVLEQLERLDDDGDEGRRRRAMAEYLADMHARLERLLDPKAAEPYDVICHGDCWTSNVLFRYDEEGRPTEARLIDWQVIRLASPIVDLAYLLFTSCDERMRHEHFRDVVELYYEALAAGVRALGHPPDECFPREAYDAHLKRFLPSGLLIAIVVCPVTICDRDERPSLVEDNESFNRGEGDDGKRRGGGGGKLSRTPRERLLGGVRDFFKFDLYSASA